MTQDVDVRQALDTIDAKFTMLEEAHRAQLRMLTEIREMADKTTGIVRVTGQERESGALGAVKALVQFTQGIELRFRQRLWLGHGCSIAVLYGDDGEMQCNNIAAHGAIDFKRDKLDDIEERLKLWNMRRLAEALNPKEGA